MREKRCKVDELGSEGGEGNRNSRGDVVRLSKVASR